MLYRIPARRLWPVACFLPACLVLVAFAVGGSGPVVHARGQAPAHPTPVLIVPGTHRVSDTADAFAYLAFEGAFHREITVSVGTKFALDMNIKTGSHPDTSAAQQYLSFTPQLLKVVSATGTSCDPDVSVTPDLTMYDFELQNEVCNGPGSCDLRGQRVPGGSISYASGALVNCPSGCGGEFRVAQINMCGTSPGRAVLHWQFDPPDSLVRDCMIVALSGDLVQNRALYTDLVVNITGNASPPPTATPCALPFSDVHTTDYFYNSARFLYCQSYISGYGDLTFRPYNSVTRAQASKMVVLAAGLPIDTAGGPHFTDVPADYPFYSYIETAYNNLAISGYSGGTFKPGNTVTRGQLAKMIAVAWSWPLAYPSSSTFRDVAHDNPFFTYVETAACRGAISGYGDDTFRYGNDATRGQVAKMLYSATFAPYICR